MKKILFAFFVVILSFSMSYAQDYNVYKADNGQTIIIKQVKNNPIVIIDTWVKTGSINETDKNNGVSHFLEHLFFKGTTSLMPGEFDKILEAKGATTNAATSKDFTHYYIEIPSKHFETALKLHADMLLNPLVPRKELEKERKVVLEEIAKDENNPEETIYENLKQMLYTTHPYKRKVIGTSDIISKITREEIMDYYNKHYTPQNMVTVIIGDIDPTTTVEMVKKEFGTKTGKSEKQVNKPERPLMKQVSKTAYQPVESGYIMIGYRGANIDNNDTYALDVLSTVLGDGCSSILYQTLKEQKQIAFSVSAGNATLKEDGIFEINANFTPENLEKVKSSLFEEVEKVRTFGITEAQLSLAKNIIERETYYSRESISNIASQIGYTAVVSDNPQYYEEYLNNIKKVKIADVKRVAIKYLNPNKAAISIVLPETCKNENIKTTSAKTHEAKLEKEVDTIKKYKIDNGAELIICKNDLNDIVAISIYAKGGNLTENIAGTADLVSSLMLKGTKNYSSVDLAKELEENGIKIMPEVTADNFTLNVLTTKLQLPKTLELLNEVINNANFADYEISKIKTAKLNMIKQLRDYPLNLAIEEYNSLIFEGSPYSYGTKIYEKTIPSIDRQTLISYYNSIFYPQNIVISVNGNIEFDEILEPLAKIFDGKKGKVINYKDFQNEILPIKAKTVSKNVPDVKTSWIVMGWQTAGALNTKEAATLQVINSILGTGMSSRLFKNIRDTEGLAYQIGSGYSPKLLKGAFNVYIGTNPVNIETAKAKLLFEVQRLKYEFVSDKELQEAKDKILGKYLLSQETNLDKAAYIASFEISGRGFEFKDKLIDLINSVTASDIIEIANKYFNEEYITTIIK